MNCWSCKYFSYKDYEIQEDGKERAFGVCLNKKSEEYQNKVFDDYFCDKYIMKQPENNKK